MGSRDSADPISVANDNQPVANGDFGHTNDMTADTENYGENAPPAVQRALGRDRRRKQQRRLVHKQGDYNMASTGISNRRQRYLADIFTTMLDLKWRWNLLMFMTAFILSWCFFALMWWLIGFSHGDFVNYGQEDWKACVDDVFDFTTALLFSIETQHTIGYGGRATTSKCPEAIIMMMIQSCVGTIIQALMTGLVFTKLSRSKKRAQTLMFSKNALITKRDGQFCLLLRLGDMRKTNLIDAHCRGILIKKRVTEEGEVLPLYHYDVNFGPEETDNKVFLVWPTVVEHVITENSPLWEMSPESLRKDRFELIIILEGTVESTGTTAQARTSYLPSEILWGKTFQRLVTFQKDDGQYTIDYSLFHNTVEMPIPHCSPKELAELQSLKGDEKYSSRSNSRNSSMSSSVSHSQKKLTLTSCKSISTQTLASDLTATTDLDGDASSEETTKVLKDDTKHNVNNNNNEDKKDEMDESETGNDIEELKDVKENADNVFLTRC